MKILAALLALAVPLPASAGDCGRWSAEMQEDEGGPVMTAYVCKPAGKASHELRLSCGTDGQLSLRFLPAPTSDDNSSDEPDYSSDFKLTVGKEVFTRKAHYEAMDGAMVLDFAIDAPLTHRMRFGSELTLADAGGKITGATFSLAGSGAALDKLIATCGR